MDSFYYDSCECRCETVKSSSVLLEMNNFARVTLRERQRTVARRAEARGYTSFWCESGEQLLFVEEDFSGRWRWNRLRLGRSVLVIDD